MIARSPPPPPHRPSHPLARWAAVPDDAIDLAEAALDLAGLDLPGVDTGPHRAHVTEIGQRVAERAGQPTMGFLAEQLRILTAVLFEDFGYRSEVGGDESDGANLIRVIERRQGLAVSLGVLYIHAARAAGWSMVGLSFPGHFLVRLETVVGQRAVLDPIDGRTIGPRHLRRLVKDALGPMAELKPSHYQPLSNRDVLVRLQNNVKVRRLRAGRLPEALAAVEAMLAFAPETCELWREAGLINSRLGNLGAAVAALERFLTLAPESPTRRRAAELLRELYGRLH